MSPIVCQVTAISTATTTTIESGAVNINLHTITCPVATTGTVTVEDTTTVPVVYFVLPVNSIGSFVLDMVCSKGLKIVTSQADTVLVTTWR